MAHRGRDTLRFGPMKPVGLIDPRTGREPYAAVQLRQDNLAGDHFSLVGFQTQIKWGDQARVLRHDSRPRAGRVRPLRHGAPQHLRERPDGARRDVAGARASDAVLRRADVRRRRLRRIGGVGAARRHQRRGAREGRAGVVRRRARRRSARWRTTCRTPIRRTTSRRTSRSASSSALDGTAAARQEAAQPARCPSARSPIWQQWMRR